MELLLLLILVFTLLTLFVVSYSYRLGFKHGEAGKLEYAAHSLASYKAEQQWEYEEGSSPRVRHNKITGEVQKRYMRPSPLAQMAVGPAFTEWRTIISPEVAK